MIFSKFLDPKNEIAFERIFRSERNKDILIHFLNDILPLEDKIVDLEFLKTIRDPEIACRKKSIVDVLCRDTKGVQTIVEMQVQRDKEMGFEKRARYYAAKAYLNQTGRGEKYEGLKEVIFLSIMDHVFFPNKEKYKSDRLILDDNDKNDLNDFSFTFIELPILNDSSEHDFKGFSFIFIELPKFKKEEKLETIEDKWIYFFKHAEETREKDVDKIAGEDEIIKRAYEELNRFNWTENEYLAYEQEIKRIRDNRAVLEYQLSEARRKGIEEGIYIQ